MKVFQDDNTMNLYISVILKEIRENMNLSQSELEAKLGVGKEYISKVERGVVKINLALLRKFTTVFNLTISDILQRAEKRYGINQ